MPSYSGRGSWFGGSNDSMDSGRTASGGTTAEPGVAIRLPGRSWRDSRKYLGGYWRVTAPNGRTAVLKQTDLGPNESTGRNVDVTYSALGKLGYNQGNFPTDAQFRYEYIGKNPGKGGGSGGAAPQRTTTTTTGPDYKAQARRQAAAQWLLQGGRDPIQLATSVRAAEADAPAQQTTTTTTGGRRPTVSGPTSGHGPGDLKELFWQGQGGIDVKNGAVVPQGFVSGHQDHVHVASGPKQVLRIAKQAQRMGLNVGENPNFGGVHPVHVQGSYHYKGQAIDVSGDPAKMRAFAAWVARQYRVKR